MKTFARFGASAAILSICFFFAGCGGVGVAEAGVPAISQIIPQTLAAGSGDTTVEIVGARINAATVVLWNGNPLATTLVNETTVASPVESASLAVPGVAQVQLMNGVTGSKSDAVQLSISAAKVSALSIATTSLPGATVGTAYNATLAATGGTQPYTWRFTWGRFPAGLSLDAAGSISGTPTAAGTYSIGLTVRDSGRPAQLRFIALTMIVAAKTVTVSPLNIVTTSLSAAHYGRAYSQTLQATGGTPGYSWSIASGSLPPGTSLASNGVISGTPSQAGTFAFAAQVTDSGAPRQSQTISLSIAVSQTPLSITTSSLAAGTAGSAYSQTLGASGGSPAYTWSMASGSLPAGLVLSSTGAITGTPTASGAFAFTAAVSDASNPVQTRTATFSLIISAVPLHVSTTSLASATAGIAYSQTLIATGGTPGYSWSIASGALPAGLTLSSNGAITGTPANSGSVTFTATVSDSGNPMQTQSATFALPVGAPQLKIAPASFAQGIFGRPYSGALQAIGGTPGYKWAVASGNLPSGLSLNSSTGSISGTPTAGGATAFTASVSDNSNPAETAQALVTISVAAVPVTITAAAVSSATAGAPYSQTLQASGGSAPYTWSITSGHLPAGLSLSAASGLIGGTPSTPGTFNFTATAADSSNPTQTASLVMSLSVNPGQSMLASLKQLSLLVPASASGVVGTAYAQTLGATGGTGSYTWSITSGSLPSGLTLSAAGVISGTPAAGANGSYTFTVSAADSGTPPQISSATISMAISAAAPNPLSIASTTLAAGTTGTAYMQSLQATGGTPGYNWSIGSGSLPAGLTLAASGVISGTPTTAGNASFTATVSDSGSPAQAKSLTTSIAIAAAQQISGPGTTWYVDAIGGSRYSVNNLSGLCDGTADAAPVGAAPNQHCAFNDIRYLWTDGTYTIDSNAGAPKWGWIGSGGDTYIVNCDGMSGGSCRIGQNGPNSSDYFGLAGNPYGSGMPPPPTGTASQPTRILGSHYATCSSDSCYTKLNGGYGVGNVITMAGASYVDIESFDITDFSNCGRFGQSNACITTYPLSDYATNGIGWTNTSTHDTLNNIRVHGMASAGMLGPTGTGMVFNNITLQGNASSGWNADPGDGTTGTGTVLVQNFNISWNGCAEEYPVVDSLPYADCTDDNSNGYGDGFGTTTIASNPGWYITFDHGVVSYNTQDGIDGLHAHGNGTTVTVERTLAYGNMGNQIKIGGLAIVRNNLVIGNCNAMRQAIPGTPAGYNSKLSDFCRAGDEAIAMTVANGETTQYQFNTLYSANQTAIEIDCDITYGSCDSTALIDFRNNVMLGFPNNAANGYPTGGTGVYPNYIFNGTVPAINFFISPGSVFAYNDTYRTSPNWGCPNTILNETSALCVDPQLADESWYVYGYGNMSPQSGSPLQGAGAAITGIATDYTGAARPSSPSIGAYQ